MAFAIRNMSVLAYANGFTLWHYKAGKDRIFSGNYFGPAVDMLSPGDMIIVSAPHGGCQLFVTMTGIEIVETVMMCSTPGFVS